MLQAARSVGADITGIDIPTFRKAAGRPDDKNKANPGGAADVLRGATKLWPKLRITISSTVWLTFRAALVKRGEVAAYMVLSDKLAPDHQYGFAGPKSFHAITVRYVAGTFYGINPLQPKDTKAQRYTEAELKAAGEAYPAGIQAALFRPALVIPPPLPVPDPTPFSQDDLDAATEEGRIAGIQSVIDAAEGLL